MSGLLTGIYVNSDYRYNRTMTMLHADSEKSYEEDKKMAEENNNFKTTLESLFKGMDGVVSSKTVVGDAIHIGGTIILPLVDVSFGIGAGAFSGDKKEKGMGGIGGKMTPSAVIVIQDGKTRLVNIKNQDTITKILDMVPDVIDRFTAGREERMTEKDVMDILDSDDEDK